MRVLRPRAARTARCVGERDSMGASGPERGTAGSKAALTAGVIVWAAVVAGGLKLVADYKTTAGAARPAPARWPRESRLEPASGRETLVIFVHPKCACTRASLTELNIIINASAARARTIVVFLRPVGV